jgi:hypothetical protein
MATAEKIRLGWGCTRGLPEGCTVAWGARMIAPADVLHDRQGCDGGEEGGPERTKLIEWLNGGSMNAAREHAREIRMGTGSGWDVYAASSQAVVTLYEDGVGKIVGSCQGSHGYVYVAAWLHEHAPVAPVPKLASYTGEPNPPIAQAFHPQKAWTDLPERRAATMPTLRELAAQGYTSVAVEMNRLTVSQERHNHADARLADFTIEELLP